MKVRNKGFAILSILLIFSCSVNEKQPIKKFVEPGNTAVLTTKFFIEDKSDITLVIHRQSDGAWNFFTADKVDNINRVARMASLDQMVDYDPSILGIADLPKGYVATRESKKYEWKTKKNPNPN